MVPPEVAWLFWEVDVDRLDPHARPDYVIERVMTRGDWAAMKWLVATFSRAQLGGFLERKGHRIPPRERAFWALITGTKVDAGRGGGRPTWAG